VRDIRAVPNSNGGNVIRRRVAQDETEVLLGRVQEIAPYATQMSQEQKTNMEEVGTGVHDAQDKLADPTADELPGVVQAVWNSLKGIGALIDTIVTALKGVFSSSAQDSLQASTELETKLITSFDNLSEEEETGKPFTPIDADDL
jgi:hypothetical protein